MAPAAGIPKKRTPRDEKATLDSNPRARRVGIASRRLGRARRHRDVAHSRRRGRYRHAAPARVRRGVRGGDPNLVLDVRIRGGGDDDEAKTRWASDAVGSAGGVLLGVSSAHWPVPVGRIGAPDARGPWLAACADASSDGSPSFVVVVAEPDDEVSSAGAADPLGDGGAWGLVARAPITIQTALPCACAYVITYSRTRAIAARGIASPGEPARVLSADPRQALTLELVPLDDAGEIAGACVGAVSLTAGDFDADARAPKTKEALVELRSRSAEGHAAGANAVARFAVTVERGRAPRRGAAPPPLLVDVRAPLVVANGCPFDVLASARGDAVGAGFVAVAPAACATAPTDVSRDASGTDVDLRRTVWIAAKESDGSACGLPARVDVEPGKPPRWWSRRRPSVPWTFWWRRRCGRREAHPPRRRRRVFASACDPRSPSSTRRRFASR